MATAGTSPLSSSSSRPHRRPPEMLTAPEAHGRRRRANISAAGPVARPPPRPWGRSRAVFCTLLGGRVDPSDVRRLLPRLPRKAGLERRVHAHGLRHTYAAGLDHEPTPSE